ncbi:hypothetical protein BZG35_01610 [Brevundimonas sp. LM2]|uniref:hypothetical protein n=1 Tax=Brevundimonas sp. LM2 TaxID=1938605 RepID=UPI000983C6B4|nr:hypothetical protein [Brevundimonas sp. LM2]AQR60495.1 hypothetical protein BZG35_01610 [Brevundimonas sp. LM2]
MLKLIRLATRPPGAVILLWAAMAIGLALVASPVWAQQVEPMVFSLTPSGAGATRTLRMENPRSAPITVEVTASAIAYDAQGAETWSPADEDFQIFPPQSLIPSRGAQAFRIRYVGDPSLEVSRSYRISLRQLPVALPEGESGIVVGVNFNTLVNVVPPDSQSDLVVNAVVPEPTGGWRLSLENKGTRYVRLTRTAWTLSDGDRQQTLDGPTLFGDIQSNLVPPRSQRELVIATPPAFDPAKVAITISAPPTE